MTDRCTLTHIGTATVLIEVGDLRFLTDPVFDDAGGTYQDGPVRLVKTSFPAVRAGDVGRLDAVLLSHDQHADNLDDSGRGLLPTAGAVLSTPLAAQRLGANARGLQPWTTHQVRSPSGVSATVTAVPARHGPEGTEAATGPVTGFLIEWSGQVHGAVYVSGDTILFPGTDEIARRARVSLALLHLGRARVEPLGDVSLSLSAEDAAGYALALNARLLVPIHNDGWEHFTENRANARTVLDHGPVADRVRWLTPGKPHRLSV